MGLVGLVFLLFSFVRGDYLWDLVHDPTETNNLIDNDDYSKDLTFLYDLLADWSNNVTDGDNSGTSATEDYVDSWEDCGGICPWIGTDDSPEIEQIYFPDSAPNIVFLLVDDWGFNDVGFRSTYMSWTTPNIDKLASTGIILDNYYTHYFCVPSRGALLTGRYALRLGLLEDQDGLELRVNETTIAQEMKSAGYRTYMVGKWHLGCSSWSRTPTYRGFDSFYGYYSGYMDYLTKEYQGYVDLHDNEDLVTDEDELAEHAAYLFQTKAEDMLTAHASDYSDTPFFMYYALQLIHFPLGEVPSTYTDRCSDADETDDISYCGMNLMLDEVVANLTCHLQSLGMWDNTVLVMASDNGGESTVSGNSVPFRGHKYDFFRGGVSANAFIHSPLLQSEAMGTRYGGLVHVTDWLPTLMSVATKGQWTGSYSGTDLDGVDMWEPMQLNTTSPRHLIVHYASADNTKGSIIFDDLKLDMGVDLADFDEVSTSFDSDLDSSLGSTQCDAISVFEGDVEEDAYEAMESSRSSSTLASSSSGTKTLLRGNVMSSTDDGSTSTDDDKSSTSGIASEDQQGDSASEVSDSTVLDPSDPNYDPALDPDSGSSTNLVDQLTPEESLSSQNADLTSPTADLIPDIPVVVNLEPVVPEDVTTVEAVGDDDAAVVGLTGTSKSKVFYVLTAAAVMVTAAMILLGIVGQQLGQYFSGTSGYSRLSQRDQEFDFCDTDISNEPFDSNLSPRSPVVKVGFPYQALN